MSDHRPPDGADPGSHAFGCALTLQLWPDDGGDLLILSGELDLASAPRVLEAVELLSQMAADHVVVDISGLRFLDAAGLSALIRAREQLVGDGLTMTLRGIPACVLRVLDITGLKDSFVLGPAARADGA